MAKSSKRLRSNVRSRRPRLLPERRPRRFWRPWLESLEPRRVLDGAYSPADYADVSPAWFATVAPPQHPTAPEQSAASGFQSADNAALDAWRWIVRLTPEGTARAGSPSGTEAVLCFTGAVDFRTLRGLGLPGLIAVESATPDAAAVTAALQANPFVASFEPVGRLAGEAVPNDPRFGQLLGLDNTGQSGGTAGADIGASEAWDIRRDSSRLVIGVIDSGADYTHPDLYLNVWLNPGEIPAPLRAQLTDTDADGAITYRDLNQPANAAFVSDANSTGYIDADDLLVLPAWSDGVDNDGNGFTDDHSGVNFISNTNNPRDDHRHGTHVFGTIAALGDNNLGVTGVNWAAQVVPLKFLNERNEGDTADAVAAIHYAALLKQQHGIDLRVLNASWGSHTYSQALRDAIGVSQQAGQLFVAAAGNGDVLGRSVNVDLRPFYPASFDLPNILSVAASDQHDQLAGFSNFGPGSVDLAAPGVGIVSTEPFGSFQQRNGTSMAAPHVTGTIALVWAETPAATPAEIRDAILTSVDPIPALAGRVASGGRLNAERALRADPIPPRADTVSAPDLTEATAAAYRFTVTYTDNVALDATTLDDFDVLVTKLGDFSLSATAKRVSVDAPGNGSPRAVTYEIAAPGGAWDHADNGQYQLAIRPGQVRDTSGNPVANRTLTVFRVNIPEPQPADVFIVNDTTDSVDANPGDGQPLDAQNRRTLRAAVMESNAHAGPDTIQLPAGVFTFTLSGDDDTSATGDLDILDTLTITGAGQDQTFLDAADLDRVLHILSGVSLTLSKLTLRNGTAATGGAVLNAGVLSISDVTISDSVATDSGGGLTTLAGATSTLNLSTITNNQAPTAGGVSNSGTLSLTDTTVADNSATTTDGGGLLNSASADATISRSTFVGNAATFSGGAITNAGTLTFVNSTLSTNSADTGGALSTSGASTLTNVTIANNSATTTAGGVSSSTENTSVRNTIIAANSSATSPDISGTFNSLGNNLIGASNGSSGFINGTDSDQVGTVASPHAPGLAPLGNYGGATATHSLFPASTALDAGNNSSAPTTDQRGASRQLDGPDANSTTTVDIGAFEFGAFFATSTVDAVDESPGNGIAMDSQGRLTLRAAIQEANAIAGKNVVMLGPGRFVLSLSGRNEDMGLTGDLDVTESLDILGSGAAETVIDGGRIDRVIDGRIGTLTISAISVIGGELDGDGAGIRGLGALVVTDAIITGNAANSTNVGGNLIKSKGGGVFADEAILIERSRIAGNNAYDGGGAYLTTALSILRDSTFAKNSADKIGGYGGGFYVDHTGGTVSNVNVFENIASHGGGFSTSVSSVTTIVSTSYIHHNTATIAGGGFAVSNGTLQITHSTISDNVSGFDGGGVFAQNDVVYTNTTISGNRASNTGGGIRVGAGTQDFVHVTISNNSGGTNGTGGIWISNGSGRLKSTIVAGNRGSASLPDIGGVNISTLGNNLIGIGGPANLVNGVNGDIVGTTAAPIDASVGPFQDNGGPGFTHGLRFGSPAIDRGLIAGAPAADQRGVSRPQNGDSSGLSAPDIGAFELIPGEPTLIRGRVFEDENANGYQDGTETGLQEWTVFLDANANGVADVGEPISISDENGLYEFAGVATGEYFVGDVQQSLWGQVHPGSLDFQAVTTLGAADRTQDVASGDLDGDGDVDLVAASFGGNRVSVFLGNGTVSFANAVNIAVGAGPVAVRLVDVDGDGDLDVVTANASGNSVSVLRNNGDGMFADAETLNVGTAPQDVVAFDVERDGDVDLVSANLGSVGGTVSGSLSVLRNNGNGTFAAAVSIAVANVNPSPTALAEADFDGNGDSDLAFANLNSFQVAILTNDGQGTFTAGTNLPVDSFPEALAAADLNGDSRPDVVVVNRSQDAVSVFLNAGNGLFAATVNYAVGDRPMDVELRDLDRDGDVDLVVANEASDNVSVLLNNGNGTFTAATQYPTGDAPMTVAVDDFDRDGKPDLATANFNSDSVTVLRNIQGFHRMTLLPSDRFTNLNFGNQLLRAELHGSVYRDLARDGARDETDTPITGWTLYLDTNNNDTLDAGETSTVTDASGTYAFTNLAPMTSYTVRQVVQTAWEPTSTSTEYLVTPTIGASVVSLDFGNFALPGEIGGRKFNDLDRDGVQDTNEVGLPDWRVYIDLNHNGQFDGHEPSDVTDANGDYRIDGLEALTPYVVDEVPKSGWTKTFPETSLTFVRTAEFATTHPAVDVTVGDFDVDGDIDIISASESVPALLIAANVGDGTFAVPRPLTIFGNAISAAFEIIAADIDNDRDTDLLIRSVGDGLELLRNDGNANFDRATLLNGMSVNTAPRVIDINSDGFVDILAGQADDGLRVRFNNGLGQFSSFVRIGQGNVRAFAVGDVDNDHDADIVYCNRSDVLELLTNVGGGRFTPPVPILASRVWAVEFGDIDNDGDLDIVAGGSTLIALINTGDGNFVKSFEAGALSVRDLMVNDLNGDGDLDVIVTRVDTNEIVAMLGTGHGAFGPAYSFRDYSRPNTSRPSGGVADFDNDEKPDLVLPNFQANTIATLRNTSARATLTIYLNPGESYEHANFGSIENEKVGGVAVSGVLAGKVFHDLNRNSFQDEGELGMANVRVFIDADNDGERDAGETSVVSVVDDPLTANVDEKGNYRFENLLPGNYIIVEEPPPDFFQATPLGVQFTATPKTTGDGPRAIASGDVDGDGDRDLAIANAITNDVALLQNQGNGSFVVGERLAAGGLGPSGVAMGDWNGDGRRDLAVANNYSAKVSLLRQSADGTLLAAGDVAVGTGPTAIAAGDWDGDGDLDLAVTNEFNNNVSLLRNVGGTFSSVGSVLVGNSPQFVTTTDVNRDGKLDLVVANAKSRNVSVLRNTSTTTAISFATAVNLATGTDPFFVTAADVTGDGYPDLISANLTTNDISVLQNRGNGTFFPRVDFAAGVGPTSVAAADLDRDGDLDLAVGNATSQQLSVLINAGNGTFGAPVQFGAADFPVSLPFALLAEDFNGDGNPDLAMTNGLADSVSILLTDVRPGPHRVTLARGQEITGLNFGNRPPNSAPTAIVISNSTLVENTYTSGGAVDVGTLTATDADNPASDHVFSLVAGTGATDNATFQIVGNKLQVKQNTTLNFETQASYSVRVRVSDGADPFDQVFSISLSDSDGVMSDTEEAAPNGGDGNADGVPDAEQSHVASFHGPAAGQFVTVAAPPGANLSNVGLADAAEAPANVTLAAGLVRFAVPVARPGGSIVVTLFLADAEGVNGYYKFGPTPDNATPHWSPFLYVGATGAKILTDPPRIELHLVDGGRGDEDGLENGVVVDPGAPVIDARPHPWQNPASRFDVNGDGHVTPIDAVSIISELNLRGSRLLAVPRPTPILEARFFDVSPDNLLSPLDAIAVIGDLNRAARANAAEGEPTAVAAVDATFAREDEAFANWGRTHEERRPRWTAGATSTVPEPVARYRAGRGDADAWQHERHAAWEAAVDELATDGELATILEPHGKVRR